MVLCSNRGRLSGAHAPLDRRVYQRAVPMDQISHYRVRPHVKDFWTITLSLRPCQKFGNLVTTSQLKDHFRPLTIHLL